MERIKLKKILLNHYVDSAANSILRGIRKPSYAVMCELNRDNNIPFIAWINIKSFINSTENDTKQTDAESSTEDERKVS